MKTLSIYRGYSANLFPLRRCIVNDGASKRPLVTDWPTANFSDAALADYPGHGVGWTLGNTDLIIDIDAPTAQRPGKKGLVSLAALERQLDLSLASITTYVEALKPDGNPRGGRHYYLTKPSDLKIVKALPGFPDIDFLSAGCYVVIAGSPHWQGGEYDFGIMSGFNGHNRAEAPQSLLDLLIRPDVLSSGSQEIDGENLSRLLDFLDATEYRDHDQWFQILAACHDATAGGDDGRKAFIAWSTSDPKYSNAGSDIAKRWKTLRPGGGITLRTLYGELKRNGRDGYQQIMREYDVAKHFDVIETEVLPTRPRVEYGLNEREMNEQIVKALLDRPNLYQRLGSLADVVFIDGTPTIRKLNAVNVRELVSDAVELGSYKFDPKTESEIWKPKRVTDTIARAICGRAFWEGVPFLKNIVESPSLLPDGSILQTPGFHVESGLFYSPSIEFPKTAESPTREDAIAAFDKLADVVCDFPFRNESHRNVFIAAVLTMVARHAIPGPVPLVFIDGNEKGVGKTLLADAISLIGAGRSMPKSNYPSRDEEMEKRITAIAMAGFQTQLIDNVPNSADFGFPSLDAALTSDIWQGRPLGLSEIIQMPLVTQFFATGNGLTVSADADTVRRISYCQLDCREENPDARKTFKHGREGDFRAWILNNRGDLVNAALTILQAYRISKTPANVSPWGSYNAWSGVVRASLVWLGAEDPILSRRDMDLVADQGKDELAIVLKAIEAVSEGHRDGLSSAEIRDAFYAFDFATSGPTETIQAAREILCPKVNTPPRTIGRILAKRFKDKTFGGRRLEFRRPSGRRCWVIERV